MERSEKTLKNKNAKCIHRSKIFTIETFDNYVIIGLMMKIKLTVKIMKIHNELFNKKHYDRTASPSINDSPKRSFHTHNMAWWMWRTNTKLIQQ